MKKLLNKVVLFFYIIFYFLSSLFKKRDVSNPSKILIVDTLRLGDVVMSTPVFRAIKEKNPHLKLSVLVRDNVAEILDGNPYIDEVIHYYGREMDNIMLIETLREKNFNTCINLCEGKLNSIIYSSKIPRRIGYIQKHRYRDRFFLTDHVQLSGAFGGITEMFLNLLEPEGIFNASNALELYVKAEDINSIRLFIPDYGGLKILIHPGGRNITRRWPYYRELIDEIDKKFNALIILTGDNSEIGLINALMEGFDKKNIFSFAGKTTLKQMAALCLLSDVVIGNDTGILHIARAVKTPTITIFGPEDSKITGAQYSNERKIFIDVPCRTNSTYFRMTIYGVNRCKKETCDSHLCMESITPDMVVKELQDLLRKP